MEADENMRSTIRIAVIGPESSGKTTLVEALSQELSVTMIPEYAREYLANIGTDYSQADLIKIAERQFKMNASSPSESVICDTEMSTMIIWSMDKFGMIPEQISGLFQKQEFDAILLCRPDLPWVQDSLRENPKDRDRLFRLYLEHVEQMALPFLVVERDNRKEKSLAFISSIS